MTAQFTAIGCDMGSKTMNISIVKWNKTLTLVKVLNFPNTIDNLTIERLNNSYPKFVASFTKIIKTYKPSIVYAERFMVRGMFTGGSAELISYMMGIMHTICTKNKIEFVPITASSWKNDFNRYQPVPILPPAPKALPKYTKTGKLRKKKARKRPKIDTALKGWYEVIRPTPAHYLDSTMIAVYAIGKQLNNTEIYSKVTKQFITSICKMERNSK